MNQDQDQSGYQASEPGAPQQSAPTTYYQPVQPAMQPPVKNKKSIKIAAIVISLSLLLIIAGAALWYFLWWQNPNRMVSQALVGILSVEKVKTTGKATLKSGDQTFVSNIGSSYGEGLTGLSVSTSLDTDDPGAKSVDLNVIYEPRGAAYVKLDNLYPALDAVIDASSYQSSEQYGVSLSQEEQDAQNAYTSSLIKAIYGQIIESIDGNWIKLVQSNLDNYSTPENKCLVETFQKLQTEKAWIGEIKQVYQKNNFLIIKEEVKSKGSSRGFVIDTDSAEVKRIAEQFGEALKETGFGKKIIECNPKAFDSDEDAKEETKKDSSTAKLTVWVDNFSHTLTSAELAVIEPEDKVELVISIDVMIGQADNIDAPKDAKSIEEVLNNSNPLMIYESYFDQSDSIINEGETAYTPSGV